MTETNCGIQDYTGIWSKLKIGRAFLIWNDGNFDFAVPGDCRLIAGFFCDNGKLVPFSLSIDQKNALEF